MASKGFSVSVCNRSHDKVDTTVQRAVAEGNLPLKGYKDVRLFKLGVEGDMPDAIPFLRCGACYSLHVCIGLLVRGSA